MSAMPTTRGTAMRVASGLCGVCCWLVAGSCGDNSAGPDDANVVVADSAVIDSPVIDAPLADAPLPDAPSHDAAPAVLPAGAVLPFSDLCPSGWTELTAYQNMHLRGHDAAGGTGETGGAATHSHQVTSDPHSTTSGGGAHTHGITLGNTQTAWHGFLGSPVVAFDDHSHSISIASGGAQHSHVGSTTTVTSETAAITPAAKEVVLCSLNSDATTLPASAIILSKSSCPGGWNEDASYQNRLLIGHDDDANLGESFGSDTHDHQFTHAHSTGSADSHDHGGNGASGSSDSHGTANPGNLVSGVHTHTFTISTSSHSHTAPSQVSNLDSSSLVPAYKEVTVCTHAVSSPVPNSADVLVLAEAACPAGWTEAIGYRDRYLRGHDGDGSFGELGGNDAHSHTGPSHDHSGATTNDGHSHTTSWSDPSVEVLNGVATGPDDAQPASRFHDHGNPSTASGGSHSHTLNSAGSSSATNAALPVYKEIIVCEPE